MPQNLLLLSNSARNISARIKWDSLKFQNYFSNQSMFWKAHIHTIVRQNFFSCSWKVLFSKWKYLELCGGQGIEITVVFDSSFQNTHYWIQIPDLTVGQVNEDAADNLSELQRISGPWGGQMGTKGDPDNRWRLSGSSISHTGCLYILSLMQDAINEMWLVCNYLWSFFRHWIVNSTSKWEMAIWVYEVLRYVPQNSTSLIFQTCMLCFLCKFWTLVFWGVPGLCQWLWMVNPSHDTGCKNIGLTSNDFVR